MLSTTFVDKIMSINFINMTNHRYYSMVLIENLFGEHEILISRGSKRNRTPIFKYMHFTNHIDAMYNFFRLSKLRLKHGYQESY